MRKLYYVYDSASGSYMYFCESVADAVAVRAFKHACETDFSTAAPDLSLYCLGTLDDYTITPCHDLVYRYTETHALKEN